MRILSGHFGLWPDTRYRMLLTQLHHTVRSFHSDNLNWWAWIEAKIVAQSLALAKYFEIEPLIHQAIKKMLIYEVKKISINNLLNFVMLIYSFKKGIGKFEVKNCSSKWLFFSVKLTWSGSVEEKYVAAIVKSSPNDNGYDWSNSMRCDLKWSKNAVENKSK